MSASSYEDLRHHVGHKIKCVLYGDVNAAIECVTCNEVLLDFDNEDEEDELMEEDFDETDI
jgi:hypothetical protein